MNVHEILFVRLKRSGTFLLFLCVCQILILLTNLESFAQGKWTIVRNGAGRDVFIFGYSRLYFSDPQNGWAVSYQDPNFEPCCKVFILHTSDGGITWKEIELKLEGFLGTDNKPQSVYFLNANEGWIGGRDKIAHTTDGGNSWQVIKVDYEGKKKAFTHGTWHEIELVVRDIYFINSKEGWVFGQGEILGDTYGPFILQTMNGGQTWQPQVRVFDDGFDRFPSTQAGILDIDFVDSLHGWAVGFLVVFQTTDGGKSWNSLKSPSGFSSVDFVNVREGWTIPGLGITTIDRAYIRHTLDGGVSWIEKSIPLEAQRRLEFGRLKAVSFADQKRGWVVGDSGTILSNYDGGQSWQLEESGVDVPFVDVQYAPNNGVFVLGNDGTILRLGIEEIQNVVSVNPKSKLTTTWGKMKISKFSP